MVLKETKKGIVKEKEMGTVRDISKIMIDTSLPKKNA